MKRLVLALLMCCSTMAYGQTTNQPAPATTTETTYQMGDDGYIQVTIPFTFRYYGIETTNSWMYDNGIISFLQPGTPGAVNPWQWNAQPLNTLGYNYYIASLWADIAPVSITQYKTQTDGTYMKYIWQDIAEYYSTGGNWRLNTFSTTLKDDGTIETHYTNINLQTSAISVGTVGDSAAGEYNQIYYSGCCIATTTGMIPDWTIAGVPLPPPPPEPVVQPEVYVAPQVVEEPIAETTSVVVVNEPEPVVVAATPTVVTVATTLVQAATESSPASVTTASIAATTSSTSSDSSNNKMSIADAQSIARSNQKNAAQLVNSVVSASIESSMAQVTTTENDTNNNSDMVMSSTNTSSTNSSTSSSIAMQSNNSAMDMGSNGTSSASSSMSLSNFARLPGSFVSDGNNETSENRVATNIETTDTSSQETRLSASNSEIVNTIADETNPTSVRSLAANNVTAKQLEDEQEKTVEIADMTKDSTVSELAMDGVQLTELQVLPIGYNIYLAATLKDAAFYAPKAIYRNQTVVDNAPAQRLLKFASDAKFDQMVSQQYGEQK